jgi:DNA-directed RNA polymerase sigma subunit (sigma70/sigma32)
MNDPSKVRLDAMTAEDIAALEARFKADPSSLSDDERLVLVGLEFQRTRARIKEIARRALRKSGSDDAA